MKESRSSVKDGYANEEEAAWGHKRVLHYHVPWTETQISNQIFV